MSGYEKSPDYGAPKNPPWLDSAITALMVFGLLAMIVTALLALANPAPG